MPNSIHPSVHATPKDEGIGGLRDRLHIFPYTYYLVGWPGPIVRRLLGVVVGTTLLVLPLATLLVLQLRFLAYQNQTVTWAQRVAVWSDVALIIALWPVIMDRGDRWRDYLRRVGRCLRRRWRTGLAWAALWVCVVASGFATSREGYFAVLLAIARLLILLGLVRVLAWLVRRWRGRRREPRAASPADAPLVRGMPGFLMVVALGVPLPLGLLADGEWWEEELLAGNVVASEVAYDGFRFLHLSEQVLLAKPAKPELVAVFREGDPEKMEKALKQVEIVKLGHRSLRGAELDKALLPGADLRDAQFQGAKLSNARLQGVNLEKANLKGANLTGANLQGVDLSVAQLQGVILMGARLQGADLKRVKLRGAKLEQAELQGADLYMAQLQGADLGKAQLQGARLQDAWLQGADLREAELQGAQLIGAALDGADLRKAQLQGAGLVKARLQGGDLRYANLYGAYLEQSGTRLIDLQAARWTPLEKERLAEMRMLLAETITDRKQVLDRIERGAHGGLNPPILESCLIDPDLTPGLACQRQYLPAGIRAYRRELFPVLEKLACRSSWTARGLVRQIDPSKTTDGRFGLAGRFVAAAGQVEVQGAQLIAGGGKEPDSRFGDGRGGRTPPASGGGQAYWRGATRTFVSMT